MDLPFFVFETIPNEIRKTLNLQSRANFVGLPGTFIIATAHLF
jgi:hypothetical protein